MKYYPISSTLTNTFRNLAKLETVFLQKIYSVMMGNGFMIIIV